MRIALLLAVALCGPAGAWEDAPQVRTDRAGTRVLPLPEEEGVFHFVVFGDRTGGPAAGIRVLEQAVQDTNLLGPDLVLTVGDLVQGYNTSAPWMEQMREYRGVMEELEAPWYPVAGNHDIYWRGPGRPPGHHEAHYETHFGPLWYWFPHKNAAFVVLYSDEGDRATNEKGWGAARVNRMSEAQLTWLRRTLQETKDFDHVFAFLHHPRWRSDVYPGTNWDAAHELLEDAGNVTAVFGGHLHRRRYDGLKDGIEYFTLGATGGGVPFTAAGTGYLHHLDVVTVRPSGITLATLPVGQVLDPRKMTAEHLADIDRLRRAEPKLDPVEVVVRPDGTGRGTATIALANPCARSVRITAEAESADHAWWPSPDHQHATLEPGRTADWTFVWSRRPRDGIDGLGEVALRLSYEYLAEGARVEMPARVLRLQPRLVEVPPSFFAATDEDRALRVTSKQSALPIPSPDLEVPDGPFTVEGWLRGDTFAGRRAFVTKTETSEYGIFVSNGVPTFDVFLGDRYRTAEPEGLELEPGRWTHLAGVFDGAEVRLYVDGRLVARADAAGERRRNRHHLYVGADPDRRGQPTSPFEGLIDEVRISSRARYVGEHFEPSRRLEPDDDTLLLLHLDRTIGPFTPDHGPLARHPRFRSRPDLVEVD